MFHMGHMSIMTCVPYKKKFNIFLFSFYFFTLHVCSVVQLFSCSVVQLFSCSVVQLFLQRVPSRL